MTSIVGVLCSDGAVIGSDSSATFAHSRQVNTIEQPTEKIFVVEAQIILAGTGSVGLGQRFEHLVGQALARGVFGRPPVEAAMTLSRATIENFAQTFLKPGQYGALVAFVGDGRPRLCEFATDDFQPEFKTEQLWYASMGSAQPITDPFLAFMREVFWQSGPPSLQEAVFAVTWTLEHAIAVNPGGVNGPVRVAVLEAHDDGGFRARMLEDEELDEHRQNIAEAKERLRSFRRDLGGAAAEGTPEVPKA